MRLTLIALLALPTLAFAQGSLTPPGAPAETMKTLDQLEPRTPLQKGAAGVSLEDNGGYTIFRPGSYYLTASFSVGSGTGITIASNDVTLDLNGFTIASTASPASGTGIIISDLRSNITIRNGHIRGATTYAAQVFTRGGFQSGLTSGSPNTTTQATRLTVTGVAQSGISGIGSVDQCAVDICGQFGIAGVIIVDSLANNCGATAISGSTVSNCFGDASAGSGMGITAWVISNSYGVSTSDTGLMASYTATNCYGFSTSGKGLSAFSAANCRGQSGTAFGLDAYTAENCYGYSATTNGLYAEASATNCYGVSNSGTGLWASSAQGCRGISTSGWGLAVDRTAENCFGQTTTGSHGLYAGDTATNCSGNNTTGAPGASGLSSGGTATGCKGFTQAGSAGLRATVAENCQGTTTTGTYGLNATDSATNCSGTTANTDINSITYGLKTDTALNCKGSAEIGTGLFAINATNCSGTSTSGSYGLRASGTATSCRGTNSAGGVALSAPIAIGCTAGTGTISATNRYNMP
jgi:hypothetical protein